MILLPMYDNGPILTKETNYLVVLPFPVNWVWILNDAKSIKEKNFKFNGQFDS